MNKLQFFAEFIVFGIFFFGLIFGAPWMCYILTGKMMEF